MVNPENNPVLLDWSVLLFIVMVLGCGPRTERTSGPQGSLIAGWRSKNVPLGEQVEMLNKLIAPGTKGAVVEHLLGQGGVWVHSHGPYIEFLKPDEEIPKGGQIIDQWALEYRESTGVVKLLFRPDPQLPQRDLSFMRAVLTTYATNHPSR